MRCPYCGKDKDRVIDSRSAEDGRIIRRRRECLACKKRFTTHEQIELIRKLTVIKRDGSRVPYDRERILLGLQRSLYKRPVSAQAINNILLSVEEELFSRHTREIPSLEIGQLVSHRLKEVDQVAYVRFASVYKQFRDLDDLLEEVRDVLDDAPPAPGQQRLFE